VGEPIRFWLRALAAGLNPLDALARWIAVAGFLLGIAGITVKLVFHLPWLVVVVILMGILLAVITVGSYHEHKRLETEQEVAFAERLAEQQTQHQAALDAQQQASEKDRAAALNAQREDYEKKLTETTKPVPQFGLSLDVGREPGYGGVTAHYLRVSNPIGQPEYRVNVYLEMMDPREPRYTPPPPYDAKPQLGLPVPPKGSDRTAPSILIGPGQEKSWLLGYTSIGDDKKMHVSRFFSDRDISWELYSGESWRLSYRIACGVPASEVPFVVVIEPGGSEVTVRLVKD